MPPLREIKSWVSVHLAKLGAAGELMIIAGAANVAAIASGLAALSGLAWWWTILFALAAVKIQLLLSTLAHGRGWRQLWAWLFYAAAMAASMVLSVGAASNFISGPRIAQKQFEQATQQAFPDIDRVASTYAGLANSLDEVARDSARKRDEEGLTGSTCGPSKGTEGPIFRLRKRDADTWSLVAADYRNRSDDLEKAKAAAQAAVANYDIRRHAQIAGQFNGALDMARMDAESPELAVLRSRVQARLAELSVGSVDALSGQLVHCQDPTLAAELDAVVRVPSPALPKTAALPLAPSHETAIRTFLAHLQHVASGEEQFDWELYGLALLGVLPELLFLLALNAFRRERRKVEDIHERVAAATGISADGSIHLFEMAARGASDSVLARLQPLHAEDISLIDRADYLRVPDDPAFADTHLFIQSVCAAGLAKDLGLGPAGAGWRHLKPPPADSAQRVRFYLLGKGVWQRMLVEAVQRAASRRAPPDEPQRKDDPTVPPLLTFAAE